MPDCQNPVNFQIAAFYQFSQVPTKNVGMLAEQIEKLGQSMDLRGLVILADEGINGTVSGRTQNEVSRFFLELESLLGLTAITPKWSEAPAWPFRKFKVRVRREIVTLGFAEGELPVQPLPPKSDRHLAPQEWNRCLQEEEVVVLDTRNWYETRIGKFKSAVDPKLDEFREFEDYLDSCDILKDRKVLIYCTGGIRCEKAIVEMENKGFQNVFQLDGGILGYLAEFPNDQFDGECFVFDQRVAVDQKLQPTVIYKMCPHCGQPADQPLTCLRCDSNTVVCPTCAGHEDLRFRTCSKNCAHHYGRAPGKKGRSQDQGFRFEARRAKTSDS